MTGSCGTVGKVRIIDLFWGKTLAWTNHEVPIYSTAPFFVGAAQASSRSTQAAGRSGQRLVGAGVHSMPLDLG